MGFKDPFLVAKGYGYKVYVCQMKNENIRAIALKDTNGEGHIYLPEKMNKLSARYQCARMLGILITNQLANDQAYEENNSYDINPTGQAGTTWAQEFFQLENVEINQDPLELSQTLQLPFNVIVQLQNT